VSSPGTLPQNKRGDLVVVATTGYPYAIVRHSRFGGADEIIATGVSTREYAVLFSASEKLLDALKRAQRIIQENPDNYVVHMDDVLLIGAALAEATAGSV
jgi:hypothetical protein